MENLGYICLGVCIGLLLACLVAILQALIEARQARRAEKSDRREWEPFEGERCCDNCKHTDKSHKDEPCARCECVNGIPDHWEAME